MAGYDIAQLKGTPLYDLARNANVYGGTTLSKTEMVFFQQQCREMGFDPAKYGLEIVSEDIEGADYKETQRAQKNLTSSIDQSYQGQFGKKNNAVQVAKDAETRAYSIINTAKEAFVRNHGEVNFSPESLGQRPNFMAPEYKGNLTKYVSDLNAWGNKVAEQYRNADAMTNEQLAALIMQNNDANANMNAGITLAVGEELKANMDENTAEILQAIQDGTAEIIDQIKDSEGNIKQTIKLSTGQICQVVRNAKGEILGAMKENTIYLAGVVHDDGNETRGTVRMEHKTTRNTLLADGEKTRKTFKHEADRIIDTLDPLGKQRAIQFVRDKAINAGKSVGDFIKENPELLIPGLGIPLYAAKKLFE